MDNIILEKQKLVLKNFKENPYAYFHYLKTCKKGEGFQLLSEVNIKLLDCLKTKDYYDCLSFKTFLCELIYNAINLFPDISEYTIKAENDMGISFFILGIHEDLADDGHPCMAKLISVEVDDTFGLNLKQIKSLYCNNRHNDVDTELINVLVLMMYMGGTMPKLSTSFKINKDRYKNVLKFK